MTAEKQIELEERLKNAIVAWERNERDAVNKLSAFKDKVKNPVVGMLVTELVYDSQKHSAILSTLLEAIEAGTPLVTEEGVMEEGGMDMSPGDLRHMSDEIGKHVRFEEKMIEMAQDVIEEVKNPVIRYLLKHIIADEEKHHEITRNLLIWPYTGRWWESPVEFRLQTLTDKREDSPPERMHRT